jgi:lipoprotein-releasing system permease protein
MLLVTSFTLISAMLMIVLERINFIGILKTLGTTNDSIRKIFIYLTNKLILKSLLLGNIIGLSLSFIQNEYKLIKLDTESYYIPHVPIEIDWFFIIILNFGIILVAYISLLAPSHIISKIEPNKSIKFE